MHRLIFPAKGYAAAIGGSIDVRTVSDTKQAAMVNALTLVFATPVMQSHSDVDIQEMWKARSHTTAKVVPVRIEAV